MPVLDVHGRILAGGGMDSIIEDFHAANAADAYFFRLNCTVGFYNGTEPGVKAHILTYARGFLFGTMRIEFWPLRTTSPLDSVS